MADKSFKPFPETEDEIWSECIRMHEDICLSTEYIFTKFHWLEAENYEECTIKHGCFFCEQAERTNHKHASCHTCPAVLVDPTFNCMCEDYDYSYYDGKFVTKLKELNKIRKAKLS